MIVPRVRLLIFWRGFFNTCHDQASSSAVIVVVPAPAAAFGLSQYGCVMGSVTSEDITSVSSSSRSARIRESSACLSWEVGVEVEAQAQAQVVLCLCFYLVVRMTMSPPFCRLIH